MAMEYLAGQFHAFKKWDQPSGHFGPVYLLQVSKYDDEECYFLKQFGFR